MDDFEKTAVGVDVGNEAGGPAVAGGGVVADTLVSPTSSGVSPRSIPIELSLGAGSAAEVSPDYLPPGTKVSGWLVQNKLGAGGMGCVYLVRHEDSGEVAALKISIPPTDESPEWRAQRLARSRREFSLAHMLEHPNIVQPLGFFLWPSQQAGEPCILMPYIADGNTLGVHCRKARPTLRTLLEKLLMPVADALDYLHRKQLCHRDVKPANIMVTAAGKPWVMDFGIAKSRSAQTLTSTEMLTTYDFGAPEYLAYYGSLERSLDHSFDYTPEADLFCLGGAFYDVLTGFPPYYDLVGSDPNDYLSPAFRVALENFCVVPPSERNAAVPPELDALFGQMMARDPRDRFSSGGAIIEATQALLERLPAHHPLLDVPFEPPVKARRQSRPELSRTPDHRSKAPSESVVPGSGRKNAARLSVAPPRPPELSNVGDPAFRPPTAANQGPRSFASPVLAAPPPQKDLSDEEDRLPTGVRVARERLAASTPPAPRKWVVVGAVAVVSVVLLGVAALSSPAAPTVVRAQSLLDETESTKASAMSQPSRQQVPRGISPSALEPASPELVAPQIVDAGAPGEAAGGAATASSVGAHRSPNPDAKAIDDILTQQYGGVRPVVPSEGGAREPAPAAKPKLPKASWVKGNLLDEPSEATAATGVPSFGIPTGAEIAVRLMKPLDSRTAGAGPAVARLMRPFAVHGAVVLPTGTMAYGQATGNSAGRFDVRFNRLRLPDGQEVPFQGLAYDLTDNKAGLKATSRVTGTGNQGPSLGEKLVKGTANAVLSKVGGDDAVDVAKGAGQTVLDHPGAAQSGASGDALLLDASTDFELFIVLAF